MSDGSKEQPKMTAGLDIGDKYSYLSASSTSTVARLWRRAGCVPAPKDAGGSNSPRPGDDLPGHGPEIQRGLHRHKRGPG